MYILTLLILSLFSPIYAATKPSNSLMDRLSTVVDGPGTLCEGFAALVEDVGTWDSDIIAHNEADFEGILGDPTNARGIVFALEGTAAQGTTLAPPWSGIEEWFIRDKAGSLFCLYVVGESQLAVGTKLRLPARFYKTIEMEGRDKRFRMYPTFVTSSIVIPALAVSSESPFLLLLLPMILIGGFVVFLLSRIGGKNTYPSSRTSIETEEVLDAVNEHIGELPEDSSQALAVMYEQSEARE